jgi:hypothetical protein
MLCCWFVGCEQLKTILAEHDPLRNDQKTTELRLCILGLCGSPSPAPCLVCGRSKQRLTCGWWLGGGLGGGCQAVTECCTIS